MTSINRVPVRPYIRKLRHTWICHAQDYCVGFGATRDAAYGDWARRMANTRIYSLAWCEYIGAMTSQQWARAVRLYCEGTKLAPPERLCRA